MKSPKSGAPKRVSYCLTSPESAERLSPFGLSLACERLPEARDLPDLLACEKLLLLRGFGALDRTGFFDWCLASGRGLLEWDFGPVMEMLERPGSPNYLFSREAVPYHWDGAFHAEPSFLVFHCVEAPAEGAGGETLFCDTERVWDAATAGERALWSGVTLTYETRKLAHYGGVARGPLARRHPATGRPVLRFAEPVETALNPVAMSVAGAEPGALLADLRARLYDPAYCYRHFWRRGDLLIADNHALLHARAAFAKDCPRHLRRIQWL